MSVKLLPPNKRKNKTYYIIGRIDGQRVEVSTGTSIYEEAKQELREFLNLHKKTKGKHIMSYAEATERYLAWRNPSERDRTWHERICSMIGDKNLIDVVVDDIIRVANAIYPSPKIKPVTKNRAVITPASAVITYAAENGWRPPVMMKRFEGETVKTRFVSDACEQWLRIATKDDEHQNLFIIWAFKQGDRVSDILQIKYEDLDLERKVVFRYISKSDQYKTLPLDAEICTIIKDRGITEGLIFPWRTRWGVYAWLRPLCQGLEIEFSPHRARHTLGKRLNDSGAGLKTIMNILGQSDPKSAIRYQETDLASMTEAKARVLGKVEGNA